MSIDVYNFTRPLTKFDYFHYAELKRSYLNDLKEAAFKERYELPVEPPHFSQIDNEILSTVIKTFFKSFD